MSLGNAKSQNANSSGLQLDKSQSKQSNSASQDDFTFSEYASDGSSIEDHHDARHWGTPPSQAGSPDTSHENLESEATLPAKPTRSVRRQQIPLHRAMAIAKNEDRQIRSTSPIMLYQPPEFDLSPPTPGLDDTPYIRFAIDQLTADEEVLGRGRHGSGDSLASYPVERIVSDEGLGYFSPRKGSDRDERPAREPSLQSLESSIPDVYIPSNPPLSPQYPSLTFIPFVLRPLALAFTMILCLLMIALLAFSAVWSQKHDGLYAFKGAHESMFFVFKFLPQFIGVFILLYLFVIDAAIHRVLPFMMMSSNDMRLRSNALYMNSFPTQFLLPRLSYFKTGQPLIGCIFIFFWLTILTVPLLSTVFQPPFPHIEGQPSGRWATAVPIAWILVAIYGLLVLALLLLAISVQRQTGLKWDPRSLADIFVLLQRSNSLEDYDASETFRDAEEFRTKLVSRSDRLGYWTTLNRPNTVFYAIGEEGSDTRRYSLRSGTVKEKVYSPKRRDSLGFDIENQPPIHSSTHESLQTSIHAPWVRYSYVPWFVRDSLVVAWIVTALVLLIAFLAVSFVHHAVSYGFPPLLSATTNSNGFSSASFLYSFLPSLIGLFLFLAWQAIDMHFRALQPFANLASPLGASAENSLLLDYPACLPIETTIRALAAGHYRVAYISLLSLLSLAIPILAGGIFYPIYNIDTEKVLIKAHLPAYYTLIAFLSIYALSFFFIFPRRKRYLPHAISSLAEIISFIYASPLLDDAAFRQPRSKTDLVTRLLNTSCADGSMPKYHFGVYRGRDGREHLGIERLKRPVGSGEMVGYGERLAVRSEGFDL